MPHQKKMEKRDPSDQMLCILQEGIWLKHTCGFSISRLISHSTHSTTFISAIVLTRSKALRRLILRFTDVRILSVGLKPGKLEALSSLAIPCFSLSRFRWLRPTARVKWLDSRMRWLRCPRPQFFFPVRDSAGSS